MLSLAHLTPVSHLHRTGRLYVAARGSLRQKSTTSAIKAGLRAESAPSRNARSPLISPGESRSEAAWNARRSLRDGRPPPPRERSSQASSSRVAERRSRGVTIAPSRAASRFEHDESRPYKPQHEYGKPRASRSNHTEDTQKRTERTETPTVDANGFPLGRKERRAAFWEQRQTEKLEDEAEEPSHSRRRVKDPFPSGSFSSEPPPYRRERQAKPRATDFDASERRTTNSPGRSIRSSSRDQYEPQDDGVPDAIEYTTAASQFVYGANVVIAVLKAQRRKIYRCYIHKRSEAPNIAAIRRVATSLDIPLTRTANDGLLSRMSDGRPHNGVVLEVSPLPARPVETLSRYKDGSMRVPFVLGTQSAEDEAVNGTDAFLTLLPSAKNAKQAARPPIVAFLDGITDPANIGSILRSAHFFGIDAVAISSQTCAPLDSAVLAKASSGACEAVPILRVAKAGAFVKGAANAGWAICAAVAPEAEHVESPSPGPDIELESDVLLPTSGDVTAEEDKSQQQQRYVDTTEMLRENVLADRPRLLMLGGEGEGLRTYFRRRADIFLTIPAGERAVEVGVDSMNVGVAAGVLMHALVGVKQTARAEEELGFEVQ